MRKRILLQVLLVVASAAPTTAQPYYFGNWVMNSSGNWPTGPGMTYSGGDETFGIGSTGGQISFQVDGGFRQPETGKINYFMD
ncbi:MAG TPA: hypothetical protein VG737_11040, partial [Cyclobacteriaceae bacterium]|nr:hypothetical protein [Cyclobacteriaceae bacterium]